MKREIEMKKWIRHQLARLYSMSIQNYYRIPSLKRKQCKHKNPYSLPKDVKHIQCQVTPVYQNKKAIVTIISDDGDYLTGRYLKEYTEKYQIPITVAGIVYRIQMHRRFWKHAVKDHMFEVVNHSYNHPRMEEGTSISMDKKRLFHEIVHSKIYFEKLFGKESMVFVCPENQMCPIGYDILSDKNFYAVARGRRGLNGLTLEKGKNPGQWLNLKRIGIKTHTKHDLGEVRKRVINIAIKTNKWIIEMWHNVSEDTSKGFQTITPKEAEKHLQYISDRKDEIWTALFTDAVKYIYERENAKVGAYLEDDCLYVFVDVEPLDINIFDQELTVQIDCSGKDFDEYDLDDAVVEGDKRFIYLDIRPGVIKKYQLQRR